MQIAQSRKKEFKSVANEQANSGSREQKNQRMRMSVHLVCLSAPRHLLSVLLTCSKSIRKTNKMSKKRS